MDSEDLPIKHRINADGLLTWIHNALTGVSTGYCQTFQNGIIEAVETEWTNLETSPPLICTPLSEPGIIDATLRYLGVLRQLDVSEPLVVTLTLTGASGYAIRPLSRVRQLTSEGAPIDRDIVWTPPASVMSFQDDIPRVLRPSFDAVWNSAGRLKSEHYDDSGNFKR